MSDTYIVEREVTINAPATDIYPLLADFREWAKWSPWDELDPNMEKTFEGPADTVGSSYSWSGNRKAGVGSMKIRKAAAPSHISMDLVFEKPFKSRSTTSFDLTETDGRTKVRWYMEGTRTLMVKIMGIFKDMDAMVGPDFEKGLAKLAAAVE